MKHSRDLYIILENALLNLPMCDADVSAYSDDLRVRLEQRCNWDAAERIENARYDTGSNFVYDVAILMQDLLYLAHSDAILINEGFDLGRAESPVTVAPRVNGPLREDGTPYYYDINYRGEVVGNLYHCITIPGVYSLEIGDVMYPSVSSVENGLKQARRVLIG